MFSVLYQHATVKIFFLSGKTQSHTEDVSFCICRYIYNMVSPYTCKRQTTKPYVRPHTDPRIPTALLILVYGSKLLQACLLALHLTSGQREWKLLWDFIGFPEEQLATGFNRALLSEECLCLLCRPTH